MRKKVNFIVIMLLAACLLTLVACQSGKDEDGLRKIKAPENLALSGSALSWDEVERAERYYIFVGDEQKAETTSTTYDLSALVTGYGDFSITVRACGDGVKYGKSDKSEAIIYHKGNALNTPIVSVDKTSKTASWQNVENAVNYVVSVYNSKDELVNQTTTSQTSYSFADKTNEEGKDIFGGFDKYRITVSAKPDQNNNKYSDSLLGSAYYINSTVLSAPQFSNLSSSRIQWNSITNAKSYNLKLTYRGSDGTVEEKEINTTSTSYQRSNFNYDKVGDYFFSIKAIGDNEVYYDSDWCEEKDDYKVTKLAGIEKQDIELVYDENGKANLTWKIDANTDADQFYLSLKGLLPDGTSKLENSDSSMTISSKVIFVEGNVYDVYKFVADKKVEKIDGEMIVYNLSGKLKVRYNGVDYYVTYNSDEEMSYNSFNNRKSEGVDLIYDVDNDKFEFLQNAQLADGTNAKQETDRVEKVYDASGNQLYYFEDDSSKENVEKSVLFDDEHNPEKLVFAINLDSIFIKEIEQTLEGGEKKTTYDYKIKDSSYYGILYTITVSAGHSKNQYVASADAVTEGRYLSYKIPSKNEYGEYEINNAGEYAYIVLKNFIDNKNNVNTVNNYIIVKNINFNGYEVAQIDTLKDNINGNRKTLSNIVVGNSQLTDNGVVKVEGEDKIYTMYLNIGENVEITDAFYMGISFVGYKKEDVEKNVDNIYVAPIAYNNNGELYRIFVQSDSIKADSAYLSGMVINNNGDIFNSQVYADLSGRIVAGIAINNQVTSSAAIIRDSGFYGNIVATTVDEYIENNSSYIAGAGLVVENGASGIVLNSEAIGSVEVTATDVDAIYAGGLVAINKGNIDSSFSGEYTRADVSGRKKVIAKGNNSYAGGLVASNETSGQITNSYATNRADAEYAGGFVGLNNGNIESAYAVGGTENGGRNNPKNGAFAGVNDGNIEKAAAYASSDDFWVREENYITTIVKEDQLGDIVSILYPDGSGAQMSVTDKDGFRYPILLNRTYTKDYVKEMSPSQIPEVKGLAIIGGEVKETSIKEEDICGDRSKRGNKVVMVINYEDTHVKLVYGKIR